MEYLNMVGVEKNRKRPYFLVYQDPNQTGFDDKNNAFVLMKVLLFLLLQKVSALKLMRFLLWTEKINIQKIQDLSIILKRLRRDKMLTVTIFKKQ
jgi:hypothetical protein